MPAVIFGAGVVDFAMGFSVGIAGKAELVEASPMDVLLWEVEGEGGRGDVAVGGGDTTETGGGINDGGA